MKQSLMGALINRRDSGFPGSRRFYAADCPAHGGHAAPWPVHRLSASQARWACGFPVRFSLSCQPSAHDSVLKLCRCFALSSVLFGAWARLRRHAPGNMRARRLSLHIRLCALTPVCALHSVALGHTRAVSGVHGHSLAQITKAVPPLGIRHAAFRRLYASESS